MLMLGWLSFLRQHAAGTETTAIDSSLQARYSFQERSIRMHVSSARYSCIIMQHSHLILN